MNEILKMVGANSIYIIAGLSVSVMFLFLVVIWQGISIFGLRSRYKKMMSGEETGATFEKMMLDNIESVREVAAENEKLRDTNRDLDALLRLAITKVGVVRFCAFKDTGSDLSYAVALLDSNDNGVIFSSIFGRDDSRSYVKPIENGQSTYTLTAEEKEAIRKAIDE